MRKFSVSLQPDCNCLFARSYLRDQAERITGNISLVLEVEMYKAEVEETWAWAKRFQKTCMGP